MNDEPPVLPGQSEILAWLRAACRVSGRPAPTDPAARNDVAWLWRITRPQPLDPTSTPDAVRTIGAARQPQGLTRNGLPGVPSFQERTALWGASPSER